MVSQNWQMLRVDRENLACWKSRTEGCHQSRAEVAGAAKWYWSDYGKGVITPETAQ
ncbi:MAG: hypothetical protein R3E76_00455 [Planctomycetota bacterium]